MDSNHTSFKRPIGVIGAGSFGIAMANILVEKNEVLLYARNTATIESIKNDRFIRNQHVNANIEVTNDLKDLATRALVIYPIIPSSDFREMMISLSAYLSPAHILIHATKGFDITHSLDNLEGLNRKFVKTISEVIREESSVVRIGCLAGPNLAKEIAEKQPAATVVASRFDEVIDLGQQHLRSERFQVYGNTDIFGIELAGALKNYIAIATGAIAGLGYGDNAKSLLITRGMAEMIYIGRALGAGPEAFLGLAGIGDLIATCSSPKSRNFQVGYRLAGGEKLKDIISSMNEIAEGVRTVQIVKALSDTYKIIAPIVHVMYRVMFEELPLDRGIRFLMRYPAYQDAEYLKFQVAENQ